jgi:head-tail adaptor
MYLQTGNLFKDFTIEKKSEGTTARGRVKASYDRSEGTQLRAVLADADPQEKERWQQQQHPITHIITQRGAPLAEEGDRLIFGQRIFYIQGVDDPGSLGIWTIYYVQERSDTHGD